MVFQLLCPLGPEQAILSEGTSPVASQPSYPSEFPPRIPPHLPNKDQNDRKQYQRATCGDNNREGKTLIKTVIPEEMIHHKKDAFEYAQNRANANADGYKKPDRHIPRID